MENNPPGHARLLKRMTLFSSLEPTMDSYQLMKLFEQQIMFNIKNGHLEIIQPAPSLWRSSDMIFG